MKEKELKICAFSHLKDGLNALQISYPSDYLQISGSDCENCNEIVDYILKLSETFRKDALFEKVF